MQDEDLREELLDGAIFATMADGQRNYRQARDLLRMKKTARQYFPVGKGEKGNGVSSAFLTTSLKVSASSGGAVSSTTGQGKGTRPGIKCLRCGGM